MSSRNESKAEKDRQKQIQEKCQTLLNEMLRDEDNKYCVDCDAKGKKRILSIFNVNKVLKPYCVM